MALLWEEPLDNAPAKPTNRLGMSQEKFREVVNSIARLAIEQSRLSFKSFTEDPQVVQLFHLITGVRCKSSERSARAKKIIQELQEIYSCEFQQANRDAWIYIRAGQRTSDRGAKNKVAQPNRDFTGVALIYAQYYEQNLKARKLSNSAILIPRKFLA